MNTSVFEMISLHIEGCRYRMLGRRIQSRRKKLQKEAFNKAYHDFFGNVGNDIIEKNYHGQDTSFVPDTSLVLPERKELAELDFQNRDASTVSDSQLLEDRIRSLELRLALHHLHIPKHLASNIVPTELARDKPFPTNFPTQSPTGLQCPDCLGNLDYHPAARQYTFSSKYALKSHIDDVHLANRDFLKQNHLLKEVPRSSSVRMMELHNARRFFDEELPMGFPLCPVDPVDRKVDGGIIEEMSSSQVDPPSDDQRRTAAISPPSQHSASNIYTFGQATSNPPISHHQAYMPPLLLKSELLLMRVTEAGYCYACVASDCFMIFKDNNELNKHIRSSRSKSHEPFATYLDASCLECEDGCGPDHDYFCHPKTYEDKMLRAFRDGLDSTSSPQGDLMLYDLAECLHKRLLIMENELRRCSGEDHFNTVFGSPTRSLKDIRVLLREQPSPPNLVNCPAPGCQETFRSPLRRIEHLRASSDQSHLFYKSILDETYCFLCGREFNSSTSLAQHNQRAHKLQPARQLGKAPNVPIQDQTPEIPPSANCSITQQDILGDGFFQPSQLLNPLSDNIGFDENELMRKLLSHDWDLQQLVPLPDLHLINSHTVSENPNIQAPSSSVEMPAEQPADSAVMTNRDFL
ncbi:hypothetical protein I7I51_05364 [Histoplasma capsulatum]|uniref:C2H2-type domain-containing protein n=1 Tax=Ajellomyces capsulatus TaxID=5037 RepID=A0A8A1M7G7_AJECA|nr:hypothetical protein I7I51_05364 [Histoplasma capsulatum]